LLDLSTKSFEKTMDAAFGRPLSPTFIASNVIPYVELTGYVGANPKLQVAASKKVMILPQVHNRFTLSNIP
jgi:hypothetical protein